MQKKFVPAFPAGVCFVCGEECLEEHFCHRACAVAWWGVRKQMREKEKDEARKKNN